MAAEKCRDNEIFKHYLANGFLYFVRGIAAAMLLPVDMADYLRRGQHIAKDIGLSWLCLATIFASGWGIWFFSSQIVMDGQNHSGGILSLWLVIFTAAIINGRLQTKGNVHNGGYQKMNHGWHNHMHSKKRGHFGRNHSDWFAVRGIQTDSTGWIAQPNSDKSSGVCCGDCRTCRQSFCIKTGRPKQGDNI